MLLAIRQILVISLRVHINLQLLTWKLSIRAMQQQLPRWLETAMCSQQTLRFDKKNVV
jgi:hypothetical protein